MKSETNISFEDAIKSRDILKTVVLPGNVESKELINKIYNSIYLKYINNIFRKILYHFDIMKKPIVCITRSLSEKWLYVHIMKDIFSDAAYKQGCDFDGDCIINDGTFYTVIWGCVYIEETVKNYQKRIKK
jgi:hypothetical protein